MGWTWVIFGFSLSPPQTFSHSWFRLMSIDVNCVNCQFSAKAYHHDQITTPISSFRHGPIDEYHCIADLNYQVFLPHAHLHDQIITLISLLDYHLRVAKGHVHRVEASFRTYDGDDGRDSHSGIKEMDLLEQKEVQIDLRYRQSCGEDGTAKAGT
jgi:hypothetical protein